MHGITTLCVKVEQPFHKIKRYKLKATVARVDFSFNNNDVATADYAKSIINALQPMQKG